MGDLLIGGKKRYDKNNCRNCTWNPLFHIIYEN